MSDTLQQAITLIQSGDRQNGKLLLADIIRANPQNDQAWLWLTVVLINPKQRRACLEQVLKINPHNQSAIKGLTLLQEEEQPQQREPFTERIGIFSGIISGTVFFYLLGPYLLELFASVSGANRNGSIGLAGIAIVMPLLFIIVALSIGVGIFIGTSVCTWLGHPCPRFIGLLISVIAIASYSLLVLCCRY